MKPMRMVKNVAPSSRISTAAGIESSPPSGIGQNMTAPMYSLTVAKKLSTGSSASFNCCTRPRSVELSVDSTSIVDTPSASCAEVQSRFNPAKQKSTTSRNQRDDTTCVNRITSISCQTRVQYRIGKQSNIQLCRQRIATGRR